MNIAVYPPCWTVPLNPKRLVHPSRLNGGLIQHPPTFLSFSTLTGGGRTLQMPVFSAMGRILLMKAYGSLNSSQLGSKTGHSGGGLNSSGRGWLIVSDRPAGNSDRTGHQFVNKSRRVTVLVFVLFLKKSRLFTVRLGGSQSSSTREEAAYTHWACTYTHTNIHSHTHTHIHAQRGECSKAVSTSAQKTRHRTVLINACGISDFAQCLALTSTF